MTGPVVSIHPGKAELLAAELARAASELEERSRLVLGVLLAVGEGVGPAADLARAGLGLADCGRRVHRILAEIRQWEAAGPPPPSVRLLGGTLTDAHRDPLAARRAARAAVAHWRQGAYERFADAVAAWGDDPVFAGSVLEAIGSPGLVEVLDRFAQAWALPADDGERRHAAGLAGDLAALLATTTRGSAPAFTVAELVDASDESGRGLAVLSLLFARCGSWEPAYLATLARAVVLPLDVTAIASGVADRAWFGGPGASTDGRVLVLTAVAADADAARLLLTGGALAPLLDERAGYLDGGAALASVLLAGARPGEPVSTGWAPFVAVVAGTAGVPSLPLHTRPVLGSVAAPWIGAMASSRPFGAPGSPDGDGPGAVEPGAVDAFLRHAAVDPGSEGTLWAATLQWVGSELAGLGPAPTAVEAATIGAMVRRIVDATHEQTRREAAALDADEVAREARWNAILAVVTAPAKVPPVAGVTVSVAGAQVVESWASSRLDEVEYLRALPVFLADGQQALEYLIVATLWRRPDRHRWFAVGGVHRATDDGLARTLEGQPFLDGSGRPRPWPQLSVEDRTSFRAWLLDAGAVDATVHRLAVEAGAAYGRGPVAAAPAPAGGVVSSGGRIEDPATTG